MRRRTNSNTAAIVRVIVREPSTKASETVLKRETFRADFMGSCCTACVGVCRKFPLLSRGSGVRVSPGAPFYSLAAKGLLESRKRAVLHFGADCPRIGRVRVIPFLLAVLLFTLPCLAQQTKTYRVPMHVSNAGHIVCDVAIEGRPATLLLDTGSQITVINPRFAKGPKSKGDLVWGSRERSRVGFALGGATVQVTAVVVDISRAAFETVDGILGNDVLREFSAVRIDYENQVIEFEAKR